MDHAAVNPDREWESITATVDRDDEAAFRFGERVSWALCSNCSGSGEGMHERSRCWVCQGRGEVPEVEE